MAHGIELAPLLTKIKVDIESFRQEMDKAAAVGKSQADKISKDLSDVTKVGEKLAKTGERLTAGVSVPLIGLGVAAGKMAVDFESSFAKVSTLLDENVVDFEDYKEELLEASDDTKIAVDEFSEAVYSSISAGVDQRKAIAFTTDSMKLAKGGFTAGAKAVDVLTTAINGYNMKAEDATKISDLLITTQNLGKTTVDELASSMGMVIPVASSVNFGMEELSASYAQLTKNGIATAVSGTYLKSMLSELGKSGSIADETLRELTGKGFADLKKEGVATTDILRMLSEAAAEDDKTLKDMFGSVEAGSAALVLAKGDGEEYNQMLAGMESSAGATQAAFEKMDATPAERMAGAVNELKNTGLKMGEMLVPIVEKVSDKISELADRFSGLSDEERENILKMGAILVAAGPVLTLAGKGVTAVTSVASAVGGLSGAIGATGGASGLIGGITGLTGAALPVAGILAGIGVGIYGVYENTKLMNSTVLDAAEDMSFMERALAKVQGMTVYTKKELQEMGYIHQEFSENISEEFQKAVEESTKKLQDFDIFMRETTFDGFLDKEEAQQFSTQVDEMCESAIETINSRKEEASQGIRDMFLLDDGTISESEQRVLDYLGTTYDTSTARISEIMDEIHRIEEEAYENYGQLREADIQNINECLSEVERLKLESLGTSNEEMLYAQNEFSARVAQMDLQSASDLLVEKDALRKEEIIQIQASYDTQIQLLRMNAEKATEEEKRDLEEQIAAHTAARDEKIRQQNELYDSYVEIVREKNPQLLEEIDLYNGQLFTKEDEASQKHLAILADRYDALNQVSESGLYRMYDRVNGHNTEVMVNYDQATKKIIGVYDTMTGEIGGYTKQVEDDTKNMASSYDESIQLIDAAQVSYVDEAGNVYDVTGENIGQMEELGLAVDETTGVIVNMNNTPLAIASNAPEKTDEMRVMKGAMDLIERNVDIYITTHYRTDGSPANGSRHYNGLDYVPFDGYSAILHKGERVLTKEENQDYSGGGAEIDYDKMAGAFKSAMSGMGVYYDSREIGRMQEELWRGR